MPDLKASFNEGARISLYYFLIGNLCEAFILIYALFALRNIQNEFNIINEVKAFAAIWIFFNNLVLWLVIQGSFSEWVTIVQVERIMTYLLVCRCFFASIAVSVRSIY